MRTVKLLLAMLMLTGSVTFSNVFAESATTFTSNLKPSDGDTYTEGVINQYAEETTIKNEYDVTVELTGKTMATIGVPTDIVFVLDLSGSMSRNNRFEKMKEAVKTLAQQLLVDDKINISIVTYHEATDEILPFTASIDEVISFVDGLTLGGETFTQDGLKTARELLEARPETNAKSLILVSDGMPNVTYKMTSIDDVVDDEIREYKGVVPQYKATGYDYNTKVAMQTVPSTIKYIYQVEDQWVFNAVVPTVSELLGLKEDGLKVYAVGVELDQWPDRENIYNMVREMPLKTGGGLEGIVTSSWTEEVEDRIFAPNELVTMSVEFKNMTDSVISNVNIGNMGFQYNYNNLSKLVENVEATYSLDGAIIAQYEFEEFAEISKYERGEESCLNVQPGSVCKLEIVMQLTDFKPETVASFTTSTFPLRYYVQTDTYNKNDFYEGYWNDTLGDILVYDPPFSFPELGAYSSEAEAEYLLRNVASDGIEGNTYFNVLDVADLNDVLTDQIYNNLLDSMSSGSASITMGEYVTLVSGAYSGEDFKIEGFKDGVASSDVATGV
ncbi:MAG: vWA domain-containing protein, partial [Anaerorhabdus sp.]